MPRFHGIVSIGMILRKGSESKLLFQETVRETRARDETGKLKCRGSKCRSVLLCFVPRVKITQMRG